MADDPLSQMRSQVDAAYAAADRLVREAEAAARAPQPARCRRAGYEGERTSAERSAFGDLQALAGLLDAARTSLPPELARQLAEAARELLLALRAADRLVDRAAGARARASRSRCRTFPSTDRIDSGGMNVGQALRELPPESRLTGGAAAALIFSMVLPWYQVLARQGRVALGVRGLHVGRGGDPAGGRRGALPGVGARAAAALPPPRRRRLRRLAGRRLGAGAADLAAVRQAQRSAAGRPRPSASTGASSWRCWPRARWWRPAPGCAPRAGPSRPTRSPRRPSGRSRSAGPASAPATAARASTPRSRRSCASARRHGRATRPSRRAGRSGRGRAAGGPRSGSLRAGSSLPVRPALLSTWGIVRRGSGATPPRAARLSPRVRRALLVSPSSSSLRPPPRDGPAATLIG